MIARPGPLLVLGATGGIGRGVVAAAVAAGRPLIAVARGADALHALRERHPDAEIATLPASLSSDAEAEALALRLREIDRPIAGVIAALGGDGGRGRLLDQPGDNLRRRFDEDLLPHLFAARHLLPLLAGDDDRGDAGRRGYVLIGGPGAEQPWAGYGHRSIAAAALRMLACVLHDEARSLPVRVQLLAVDSPACTERNRQHACTQWPGATAIGRRALALLDQAATRTRALAVVPYQHSDAHAAAAPAPASPATRTSAADTQLADSDASPLSTRCRQDARTLLQTLSLPHSHQEPSP